MEEHATDNRSMLVQLQPWVPNYKYYVGIGVIGQHMSLWHSGKEFESLMSNHK